MTCYQLIREAFQTIDYNECGFPAPSTPSGELYDEMESLLGSYTDQLLSIARAHTVSKLPTAKLSEKELFSGVILAKWADPKKRREATMTMNLQVTIPCRIHDCSSLNQILDTRIDEMDSIGNTQD